jgi:hypothetical protein
MIIDMAVLIVFIAVEVFGNNKNQQYGMESLMLK